MCAEESRDESTWRNGQEREGKIRGDRKQKTFYGRTLIRQSAAFGAVTKQVKQYEVISNKQKFKRIRTLRTQKQQKHHRLTTVSYSVQFVGYDSKYRGSRLIFIFEITRVEP